MTLNQVMGKAADCMLKAMQSVHNDVSVKDWAKASMRERRALRAAILSYGRAERERAAKVCDILEDAIASAKPFLHEFDNGQVCALAKALAAIRSLPDKPAMQAPKGRAA